MTNKAQPLLHLHVLRILRQRLFYASPTTAAATATPTTATTSVFTLVCQRSGGPVQEVRQLSTAVFLLDMFLRLH